MAHLSFGGVCTSVLLGGSGLRAPHRPALRRVPLPQRLGLPWQRGMRELHRRLCLPPWLQVGTHVTENQWNAVVLFDMQNKRSRPFLTAMTRILMSGMPPNPTYSQAFNNTLLQYLFKALVPYLIQVP
jgi:hypothetical protein